ncbi:MAG: polymer-forming cytoskeletal protein [Rhodospirillales bacterium]|nr:polymer-forming cytoskeletal protein [Rhodospirillales bacterium]
MFGKDKGKNLSGGGNAGAGAADIPSPPLKPFSKNGSHAPARPTGAPFRPEIPRRMSEIPGAPNRADRMLSLDDDANRLTIGRNINITGEITACEKLVVEGTIEAELNEAHSIVVKPSGHFKGQATVNEADIGGRFDGTLVVRNTLTIRKEGRVSGSVRYGRIVIESGGEISGDMASLDAAAAAGTTND